MQMEKRLATLEEEVNFMSENCYQNLLNEIAFRIDGDLPTHLPKVDVMQQEITELKKQVATLVEFKAQISTGSSPGGGIIDQKNKNQVQEVYRKTQDHDRELRKFKLQMENTVNLDRFEQVEAKLHYLMTTDYVISSQANLKKDLMEQIKKAVEMIVKLDVQTITQYVSKAELTEKIFNLNQKIDERLTVKDFNGALKNYDDQIKEENKKTYEYVQSVKKYMNNAEKEFADVKEDLKTYDGKLSQKCSIQEAKNIWNNFGRYSLYEDLKELYQKTVPEIKRFEERLVQFSIEMAKSDTILRRFDEILTEKASKQDLREVQNQFQNYTKETEFGYLRQGTEDRIMNVQEKIFDIEANIEMLGRNLSKEIFQAVRRAVNSIGKNQADHDGKSGLTAEETTRLMIHQKAERVELENLIALKSNKVETELAFKWVELVHKQLKQTLVLLIEMLRY